MVLDNNYRVYHMYMKVTESHHFLSLNFSVVCGLLLAWLRIVRRVELLYSINNYEHEVCKSLHTQKKQNKVLKKPKYSLSINQAASKQN